MKKYIFFLSLIFAASYSFADVDFSKSLLSVSANNPSEAFHVNIRFSHSDNANYEIEGEVLIPSTLQLANCPAIPAGIYKTAKQTVALQNGTGISSLRILTLDGPISFSLFVPSAHVDFYGVTGSLLIEQVQGYHCSANQYLLR